MKGSELGTEGSEVKAQTLVLHELTGYWGKINK